jgi:SAM-dependent methyltransferase
MSGTIDDYFDEHEFAELYDAFNGWMAGDDFYLALARETGGPVLDVGCGTGMLACRIAAEGLEVTGADPAEGMLRIARARPGAERVRWLHTTGQALDLDQRFDLAYMTGHAFQMMLTDGDAVALLRAVGRHLSGRGRFALDTRNPLAREWEEWTFERDRTVRATARHGRVEESTDARHDPATGIVSMRHRQRFLDRGTEQIGTSRIRFIAREHLERLIDAAGLVLLECYGDWDRSPFTTDAREIIAIMGRKG